MIHHWIRDWIHDTYKNDANLNVVESVMNCMFHDSVHASRSIVASDEYETIFTCFFFMEKQECNFIECQANNLYCHAKLVNNLLISSIYSDSDLHSSQTLK